MAGTGAAEMAGRTAFDRTDKTVFDGGGTRPGASAELGNAALTGNASNAGGGSADAAAVAESSGSADAAAVAESGGSASAATVAENGGSASAATVAENGGSASAATVAENAGRAAPATGGDAAIVKGASILGTYQVISDAIQGGMGKVWRVRHTGWNTDLAMKQPKPELFRNEEQKESFIHECEAWIKLGLHPQIVSCYYVREIGGIPSVFAEWMEGGSLKDWIESGKLYSGDAGTNLERVLNVAIQFGRGLHYAHSQGLIHQDVKPDNLLLTQKGEAKVADFGITRARSILTVLEPGANAAEDSTVVSASGAYTPAYCSLEQLDGKALTRRTDIYSWAVSVLEMFLGERLWPNGVVAGEACDDYFSMAMRTVMPRSVKDLLRHCLAMNPDERPHDFAEIDAALLRIYRETTGAAYPSGISKAAADTPDSLNNRALSLLDLGKPKEAEELWNRALSIDSGHLDSVYNLNLYAWRNSRSDDHNALQAVERYLRKEPEKTGELQEQIKKERWGVKRLRSLGKDRREQTERTERISLAAVTSDGDTVLTYLSVSNRFQAWHAQTGERLGAALENDRGVPLDIRFTHSGDGFWVMYEDSLLLRGFPGGEGICEIAQEGFPVIAFGLDRRGKYIVTLSWHERKLASYSVPTVTAWDLETGEKITERNLEIEGDPQLSPDGQRYIVRSAAMATLEMRNTLTGEKLCDYIAGKSKILDFDINEDFTVMASLDKEHTVRVWNIQTRKVTVGIRIAAETGGNEKIKILRGGRLAMITGDGKNNLIRIIDLATGRILRTVTDAETDRRNQTEQANPTHTASARPLRDGHEFLLVSAGSAEVWSVQESFYKAGLSVSKIFKTELRAEQEAKYREQIAALRMHLEKKQIKEALYHLEQARNVPGFGYANECLALRDELIPYCRIAGFRKAICKASYKGHRFPVLFCAVSKDGGLAVSGCGRTDDRMAALWDVKTGRLIRPFDETRCCEAAAFCDGGALVIGDYKSLWRVSLYTAETEMFDGTKRRQYQYKFLEEYSCGGIVSYIRCFPQSRMFASACRSEAGGLFDLRLRNPGQSRDGLTLYKDSFQCAAFTRDGASAYLGLKGSGITVIDTQTGMRRDFSPFAAQTLAVSDDDRYAAAGAADGGVKILRAADGVIVASVNCGSKVNALAFTHAGGHFVCGCENGAVGLFDMQGRALYTAPPGQHTSITSLSVGPGDLFFLTGERGGGIFRWDIDWIYEPSGT